MRTRYVVVTLIVLGVAFIVALRIRSGGFSTRVNSSAPERLLARAVRRLAVPRSGRDALNPIPFSPDVWAQGRAHFADHCATCHGNDGRGNTEVGRSLYPKAPDMRRSGTQGLRDGELYWIIENGVRLTGMPAWGDGTGNDKDTWKLVHFVRHLSELTDDQLTEWRRSIQRARPNSKRSGRTRIFWKARNPTRRLQRFPITYTRSSHETTDAQAIVSSRGIEAAAPRSRFTSGRCFSTLCTPRTERGPKTMARNVSRCYLRKDVS